MTVFKSACGAVIITLYAVALMTAFGCDDSSLSPTPVAGDKPESKPSSATVCELYRQGKIQTLIPLKCDDDDQTK